MSKWPSSQKIAQKLLPDMYAIKLELKLNNKERTLMARHSGKAKILLQLRLSPLSDQFRLHSWR
jgi:hypothetical protein